MSKIRFLTVHVVAWENENGGGFDWYHDGEIARAAFTAATDVIGKTNAIYQFRARVTDSELATSEIDDYIWNGKSDDLKVLTFESDPLDCRPSKMKLVTKYGEIEITKEQDVALDELCERTKADRSTLTVRPGILGDPCILVPIGGIMYGIEPDGYTHT